MKLSGQPNDNFHDIEAERSIELGSALKEDKECPKCGRDMIYNPEKKGHDCTGMLDGCFYFEGVKR
jgi:hypothetical protein